MSIPHFEELRSKINARLEEIDAPHRHAQIVRFPWLYGALGEVPSDVMFICENPSLAGVSRAHVDTVDGGPPDIEAQWWGGATNPAAKRFRVALHRLGLKTSPPSAKGGWRCYITNVIKEMNVAGAHASATSDHRTMAQRWAQILAWELAEVRPKHVFTVGTSAHALVRGLVTEGLIPRISPSVVTHFSARTGDAAIIQDMIDVVSRMTGHTATL
jgi:hypothetical protein